MKEFSIRRISLLCITFVCFIGFIVFAFRGEMHPRSVLRENTLSSLKQADRANLRQTLNINALTSVLSDNGIIVDKAILLPAQTETSQTILVRWDGSKSYLSEQKYVDQVPKDGSMSLGAVKKHTQGLTRQRSLDLSPTQVLVIAVNQQQQLLWWTLLPDPRLFRVETADEAGRLSGKMLYYTKADFLVTCPTDPAISELFFYHPQWDGLTYQLESVGKINLSASNNK